MSELRSRLLQNVLGLVAAVLIVGALLPWSLRLPCIFGAVGVLLLLAILRFQDHRRQSSERRSVSVYGQIERLRSDRSDRLRRGRRFP